MEHISHNRSLKIDHLDTIDTVDSIDFAPVSCRSPRRAAFTIVELLGVILTLATLFALILPAVKLSIRTAQKRQAAADATAFAQAVLRYRQTYGCWPTADEKTPVYDADTPTTLLVLDTVPAWVQEGFPGWQNSADVIPLDHADVISALIPSEANDANPRRIRFLDIPDARLDGAGRFLDPWGVPYALVIHPPIENDGTSPEPGGGPSVGGRPVGWSDVVAFSFGPPGRVRSDDDRSSSTAANLIFSAGVPR